MIDDVALRFTEHPEIKVSCGFLSSPKTEV